MATYKISAYYDGKYRGLADSAITEDASIAREYVWEFLQEHFVEIKNLDTGERKRYAEPSVIEDYDDIVLP